MSYLSKHSIIHPLNSSIGCTPTCKGFTLLEIIIVTIIISILFTFAIISIGDGGQSQVLKQETQRLMALIRLAHEEAIMQAKEMGVSVNEYADVHGYTFYLLQEQQWQTLTDEPFHPHRFSAGVQAEVHLAGNPLVVTDAENAQNPQILILSSGELTPFEILIKSKSDEKIGYQLTGTMFGILMVNGEL
jgi:general secretion pathway protein H